MNDDEYTLERFVEDLRRLNSEDHDEHRLLSTLEPLVQRFALSRTWVDPRHYEVDSDQGFGAHVLHEEPDHTLAVFAASWLPGRGTPPHDHGTWAIVVGVDGPEKNIFWARVDDGSRPGYAELRQIEGKALHPGEVLTMPAGTIHSVRNESAQITLSLHVYGKHINFTQRSQFDPVRRTRTPFIVKLASTH
ncbi:MAG TPA: cysteine dioxygenase family protein [Burkholderiales bacterium]|nr:cysteine dioxygenase family protein [Burkholderiales bacterium]